MSRLACAFASSGEPARYLLPLPLVTPGSIDVDEPMLPFTTVFPPAFVIAVESSAPKAAASPIGTAVAPSALPAKTSVSSSAHGNAVAHAARGSKRLARARRLKMECGISGPFLSEPHRRRERASANVLRPALLRADSRGRRIWPQGRPQHRSLRCRNPHSSSPMPFPLLSRGCDPGPLLA